MKWNKLDEAALEPFEDERYRRDPAYREDVRAILKAMANRRGRVIRLDGPMGLESFSPDPGPDAA